MLKPGMTMYARAAEKIARPHCGCCGAVLDAHQAFSSGVCDTERCREWKIAKVGAELLERRRRELIERLFDEQRDVVAKAAAEIGAAPDEVVRGRIPWQGSAVHPLDDGRRADFAEHLREIVAEAFDGEVPRDDLSARETNERPEAPVTAVACAACRGLCCTRGGNTGLLRAADIARWRQREPEVTAEEVVGWYMERLPAETVHDGCVYQSASGCALPRDRRSDSCNTYYCRSLEMLREALQVAGDDPKVVMIVDDEDADAAKGVVGWSAARGGVGFVAAPVPAAAEEAAPGDRRDDG